MIWFHSFGVWHSLIVQIFQILRDSRCNSQLHTPMLTGCRNDIIKYAYMQNIKKITIGHGEPTWTVVLISVIVEVIFSVYSGFYSQSNVIRTVISSYFMSVSCRNGAIIPGGVRVALRKVKTAVDVESCAVSYILNGYLLC